MIKPIMKDIVFLAQKSEPAERTDTTIGTDLKDTLKANEAKCLGMAANMIGVRKRIIIANVGTKTLVMYNPVITSKSGPYKTNEGCMSLPGERSCTRYDKIEVEYLDSTWSKKKIKLTGLSAQIVQHECDHLEGIII